MRRSRSRPARVARRDRWCRGLFELGVATLVWLLATQRAAEARTLHYTGTLESRVRVRIEQRMELGKDTADLEFRTGTFTSFDGKVNRQTIEGYAIRCDPEPDRTRAETDEFGNERRHLQWKRPGSEVRCTIELTAGLATNLAPLGASAEVPLASEGRAASSSPFLRGSKMVAQDESEVRDLARQLASGARGRYDAIARVMNYVIDHVEYEVNPRSFGALHALSTGRGNCQNYAHLATALLHDLGIEARVVYGFSLSRPWRIPSADGGSITLDSAQGRHAWIEVNLPDVGWVSFDPQSTQFFVSTHLVRQAVGIDSPQVSDLFSARGGSIRATDKVTTEFLDESNTLAWSGEGPAPNEMVIAGLAAQAGPGTAAPIAPPSRPKPILVRDPRDQPATGDAPKPPPAAPERPKPEPRPASPPPIPTVAPPSPGVPVPIAPPIGPAVVETKGPSAPQPPREPAPSPAPPNLPPVPAPRPSPPGAPAPAPQASPVDVHPPAPTTLAPAPPPTFDELAEIGLLDLSEDAAEYVTSKEVFAQRFELRRPLLLWDAELALQKFGGEGGALWVEILEDVGGLPGAKVELTSSKVPLADLPLQADYGWVPFSFRRLGDQAVLAPGRHWLALRYTDDAIVNWHCRIGNAYLDPDDTRSRPLGGGPWNNLLLLDFNFLLTGLD